MKADEILYQLMNLTDMTPYTPIAVYTVNAGKEIPYGFINAAQISNIFFDKKARFILSHNVEIDKDNYTMLWKDQICKNKGFMQYPAIFIEV